MSMSLKVAIRLTFDRKMIHIKCGFPANNVCRSLSKRFWVSGGYVVPISIIEEVYDAFNNSEDDLSITYSRAFCDALNKANCDALNKANGVEL